MQSDSIDDFSSLSKSEYHSSVAKSETDTFSQRKRRRGGNNGKGKGWSKKEEERILKYALKLSEKEYQQKQAKEVEENLLRISEVEEVKVVRATEEDFLNPLRFFDSLWNQSEISTGIVKIIPPESWVVRQKSNLESNYKPKLEDPTKKLFTRKQSLNELYLAKVI